MSKKPIIGGIILAAIIGVVFVGAQINPDGSESIQNDNVAFHVTLADPALYDENGLYYGSFTVEERCYEFRFVANGDSPKNLSIILRNIPTQAEELIGFPSIFVEDYNLQGTLVESELSSWEVWDYLGQKKFCFDPSTEYWQEHVDGELSTAIEIIINPHRNYDGPVSIDLIKLD